jgi:hypothetical protein
VSLRCEELGLGWSGLGELKRRRVVAKHMARPWGEHPSKLSQVKTGDPDQ